MSDRHDPIEKRFIFHANAVAFAAHVRRPSDVQIPAVASSCLPVTGGTAMAGSGEQKFFDGNIRFASASTSASGDFADTRRAVDFTHGNHGENALSTHTFVDSKLSGLKITVPQDHPPSAAGKVLSFAAGELHARLESFSDRKSLAAFRGLEAHIKKVFVNDHELIVTTAPELCTKHETYDKLVAAYEADGDFRKRFGPLFYPTGHEKTGVGALLSKHTVPNAGGLIAATVVTSMKWGSGKGPEGAEISGNRLKVEGIGTVYFGEILFERHTRRLTLLRLQLGSPFGIDGSACDVQSNGQGYPPET